MLVETSMAIAAPRAATVERVPRFVAVVGKYSVYFSPSSLLCESDTDNCVVKKDMESARKGWGRSCRARYGSSLN